MPLNLYRSRQAAAAHVARVATCLLGGALALGLCGCGAGAAPSTSDARSTTVPAYVTEPFTHEQQLIEQGARLVVCDGGGPGTPRLVHGGEFTEGGRGLRVVDSLAARWGSFRLAGALAVWCDFGQPLHAAAGDAWAWLQLVLPVCDLSASGRPVAAVMPGTLAGAGAR